MSKHNYKALRNRDAATLSSLVFPHPLPRVSYTPTILNTSAIPPSYHALPCHRAFACAFVSLTHTASSLRLLDFWFTHFSLKITSCRKPFQVPTPSWSMNNGSSFPQPLKALCISLTVTQMTLHWICLLPVSSTPMMTSSLRAGNTFRPLVPSRRAKHSLDERMIEIWKLLETSLREKIWEEDQNENINRDSLTSYVKWPPAPVLLVENVSTLIC